MIEDAIADETFARIVANNESVDAAQMLFFTDERCRALRGGNGACELHHALRAVSWIRVS